MELGDMGDFLPIGADLEKDGMLDLATQKDGRSQCICHQDEISEDASAAKEDVSLTSDNFYRTKRFSERLRRSVESYNLFRPAPQYGRALASAACMPLVLARE